jgi:hypothetical protein
MCGIGTRKSANEPRRSLDCIRRALQIDPTCSYGHFLLGIHHLFRNHAGQARGCAERALELALGMPFETGAAGLLLSLTGERERGERLILQARRINPRLPGWIHWDGDHLFENLRENGRRMDERLESLCSRAELRL